MSSTIQVELLTKVTPELVEAFSALMPQLSCSYEALDIEGLEKIIFQPSVFVLLARDGKMVIVGTLSLIIFRIPTGIRAWIEDVVVDSNSRGNGIGKALVEKALTLAYSKGAKSVDLTSRPSRKPANKLYQNLGFELRDTNVYRHK